MHLYEKPQDQDFEDDDPAMRYAFPVEALDFEEDDAWTRW